MTDSHIRIRDMMEGGIRADGSWRGFKDGVAEDLMKLSFENFDSPQIYWLVVEERLRRSNLSSREIAKIRQMLLERC